MTEYAKITDKEYKCPICLDVSTHATNHNGEIYPECKVCSNKGMLLVEGGYKFVRNNSYTVRIVPYRLNLEIAGELLMYNTLCEYLTKTLKFKMFDVLAPEFGKGKFFEDRWNSSKGFNIAVKDATQFESQYVTEIGRLHNWFEFIYPNIRIRNGYYLIHK